MDVIQIYDRLNCYIIPDLSKIVLDYQEEECPNVVYFVDYTNVSLSSDIRVCMGIFSTKGNAIEAILTYMPETTWFSYDMVENIVDCLNNKCKCVINDHTKILTFSIQEHQLDLDIPTPTDCAW